jgi:DNA-binding NarL/FixJ family response regulator
VKTRVLIVDHHASFRQSLARYLAILDARYEVVGEAGTDEAALAQVGRLRPDIAFVDIDLPDRNGIATTRCIRIGWPTTAVIALSSHPDEEYCQAALDAGATDCIDKLTLVDRLPAALLAAIHSLAAISSIPPIAIDGPPEATA